MESLLSELTAIQSVNDPKSQKEEQEEQEIENSSSSSTPTEDIQGIVDIKKIEEDITKIEEQGRSSNAEDEGRKVDGTLFTLDEESIMPESLNINPDCSWRSDSHLDEFDEDEYSDDSEDSDDSDDSYDSDDSESEEAAAEWLRQYYLRQKGVPAELAKLPSTIQVSLVRETEQERQLREMKVKARREEALRRMAAGPARPTVQKGKRKFGDRMELEEASRDDFDNGQDYVDFLNGKLKNVSIKVTK